MQPESSSPNPPVPEAGSAASGGSLDLTKCQEIEIRLARRARIISAIAAASQELLVERDLNAAIPQALGWLGRGSDQDRAYLFEYHPLG